MTVKKCTCVIVIILPIICCLQLNQQRVPGIARVFYFTLIFLYPVDFCQYFSLSVKLLKCCNNNLILFKTPILCKSECYRKIRACRLVGDIIAYTLSVVTCFCLFHYCLQYFSYLYVPRCELVQTYWQLRFKVQTISVTRLILRQLSHYIIFIYVY